MMLLLFLSHTILNIILLSNGCNGFRADRAHYLFSINVDLQKSSLWFCKTIDIGITGLLLEFMITFCAVNFKKYDALYAIRSLF